MLQSVLPDLKFQTSVNFTKSETCLPIALLPCLFEPVNGWIGRSSVFIFCQASWVDPFHVFDAFRWLLAVYRRPVPYLFRLPFPNRASDSGVLYINFNRNHLTFPVALLDFQVEARLHHSFANHAYALHTASCISYHVRVLVVYCFVLLSGVASSGWFR